MSEAWGSGLATVTADGRVLDALFPEPRLGAAEGAPGTTTGAVAHEDPRRGVQLVEVDEVDRVLLIPTAEEETADG
jgi:hypothetical protein